MKSGKGEEPFWSELSTLSGKLRGLAHLIESQRVEDPPLDLEEVHWGIGQLLGDISEAMREISRKLEHQELERIRKRISNRRN